ncbi:MAG TPA: hypothetical protein VHB79_11615 [Polyangiaceae bacterium]|nr:hypothetical protein [Polyangiaceae bacterium]
MRSGSAVHRLRRRTLAWGALSLSLGLCRCASTELPPPRADAPLRQAPAPLAMPRLTLPPLALVPRLAPPTAAPSDAPAAAPPSDAAPAPASTPTDAATPPPDPNVDRCSSVPPLNPDGSVPPAPPHPPLGIDVPVDGDRPVYVLPGDAGDARVIVYLHGMCGDATAADYFREAVRAHGTLIALRGDTPCDNGRFKWRDDASKIQKRLLAAFQRVSVELGGKLSLEHALLFGYSQGADRAEKLAARFPKQYPRVVLGGPPMKASPSKLGHAERVVILGGELETTENMRAGFDALQGAGIACRYFTLECAYHGYFGIHPEAQLGEALDWVSAGP